MSRTSTSATTFVSPGTKLRAELANATNRPSADIDGAHEAKLPISPFGLQLAHSVCPSTTSRTNTCWRPESSPGTTLCSSDTHATKRPSVETGVQGYVVVCGNSLHNRSRFTREVAPVTRS